MISDGQFQLAAIGSSHICVRQSNSKPTNRFMKNDNRFAGLLKYNAGAKTILKTLPWLLLRPC
jgi:hypothetical protein